MRNMRALLTSALAAAVAGCSSSSKEQATPDTSSAAESDNPATWVVLPDSFGPVPLGVPVVRAAGALGDSLAPDFSASDACSQTRTASMPPGTRLMILRDSVGAPAMVERVDVDSTGVHTREGAGVGDSEAKVIGLYSGRIRVGPHKYTGPAGHYLTVTSPRDSAFLIIFETDGQKVLRFHAGRRPAVQLVEGCS